MLIAFFKGNLNATGMPVPLQNLVHTPLVNSKGGGDAVLEFAMPMAKPDLDSIFLSELVAMCFHRLSSANEDWKT